MPVDDFNKVPEGGPLNSPTKKRLVQKQKQANADGMTSVKSKLMGKKGRQGVRPGEDLPSQRNKDNGFFEEESKEVDTSRHGLLEEKKEGPGDAGGDVKAPGHKKSDLIIYPDED